MKFHDTQLIRMGQAVILTGICAMLLPLGNAAAIAGLILVGLGCAPIYPCVIHSTPEHFGAQHSHALIGVQMASAYIGTSFMPPLFGLIAQYLGAYLLPVYMGIIMVLMVLMALMVFLAVRVRMVSTAVRVLTAQMDRFRLLQ